MTPTFDILFNLYHNHIFSKVLKFAYNAYFAGSVYTSEILGQTNHIIRTNLVNFYNAYKCIPKVLSAI
jgi:hypothetical protein